MGHEDLRLVLELAEGAAVEDAVTVELEAGAVIAAGVLEGARHLDPFGQRVFGRRQSAQRLTGPADVGHVRFSWGVRQGHPIGPPHAAAVFPSLSGF